MFQFGFGADCVLVCRMCSFAPRGESAVASCSLNIHLQEQRKGEVQRQAELVAFERHNVAAASDRTADAIAQQGVQEAQRLDGHAGDVETSGHAVKMNAERARSVKVCLFGCKCHEPLFSPAMIGADARAAQSLAMSVNDLCSCMHA